MVLPLDIGGDILTAISAFLVIGIIIALAIGYALYRFLSGLDGMQRALITAFLVLVGIVLIVTVIGASVGVVVLFSGVFLEVFSAFSHRGQEEE